MTSEITLPAFTELGLAAPILHALQTIGYETPSAIQAETIPYLLAGRDVLGQAPDPRQVKTAACLVVIVTFRFK